MWNDAVSQLADAIEQNPGIVSGVLTSMALAVLLILVRRLKRWAAGENLPIGDTARMIIDGLTAGAGWCLDGDGELHVASPFRLGVYPKLVTLDQTPLSFNRRERREIKAAYFACKARIEDAKLERLRQNAGYVACSAMAPAKQVPTRLCAVPNCEVCRDGLERAANASKARG